MPVIPILPAEPLIHAGFSVRRKPTFASLVSTPPSGREVTGYQQQFALIEFELVYEVLRGQGNNPAPIPTVLGYTEMETLSEFWLLANAQYGTFCYEDPDDNTRINQQIAVGDGDAQAFLMQRTWSTGNYPVIEPIGIVDVRIGKTLNVYIDGLLIPQPGNWWIDTDLRTLAFAFVIPNGLIISADFSYFYFCRFIEDLLDLEEFGVGWWRVNSLKFRSTSPDPIPPVNSLIFTPKTLVDQDTDITTQQGDNLPTAKIWLYVPSFGTFAGSGYVGIWWAGRRSTAELITDNPLLPPTISDGFPPESVSGSGAYIALPDEAGAFQLRIGMYWAPSFGFPTVIYMKIMFLNTNIPDVEFIAGGGVLPFDPDQRFMYTSRKYWASRVNPELPIQVHLEYRFEGTGNLFPMCNPASNCEPFHGGASINDGGDAFWIVEWWGNPP